MKLILYRNWLPPRLVVERGSLFPLSLFCRSCSCAPYLALRTRTVYPRLSVEPARTRPSIILLPLARIQISSQLALNPEGLGEVLCHRESERAIRSLPLPVTYEACRFFCGGSAPSGFPIERYALHTRNHTATPEFASTTSRGENMCVSYPQKI